MLRRGRLAMRGPQKYPYQIRFDPALVMFLQMNEGAGAKAHDSSIYANHGTLVNSPTWQKSVMDNLIDLNGTTQYLTCGTDASLTLTKDMTLLLWVNPDNVTLNETGIARYGAAGNRGYLLYKTANDCQALISTDGTAIKATTTKNDMPTADKWYLIAQTYDGIGLLHYVNGVQSAKNIVNAAIYASTDALTIGWSSGYTKFLDAQISMAWIFNRTLSEQEIIDIYERTKPLS